MRRRAYQTQTQIHNARFELAAALSHARCRERDSWARYYHDATVHRCRIFRLSLLPCPPATTFTYGRTSVIPLFPLLFITPTLFRCLIDDHMRNFTTHAPKHFIYDNASASASRPATVIFCQPSGRHFTHLPAHFSAFAMHPRRHIFRRHDIPFCRRMSLFQQMPRRAPERCALFTK